MAAKRQSKGPPRRVLELELARERRISAALRAVGAALGSTLDLDDVLELILDRTSDLLEAERATLYLLDDERGELVSRVVLGQEVQGIRLKVGHGIAGLVAQTGRAIRLRDAYQDPRFEPQWDLLTGFRTTSMLAVPLKNHLGRSIGVIQALNKQSDSEFSEDDEALLGTMSTQAAVAIDNSRLFIALLQKNKQLLDTTDQLERKVADLELLFELEHDMAHADGVEELVRTVLMRLTRSCGARGAALRLAEARGRAVQYVFDRESPEQLQSSVVGSDEGLLGLTMSRNEPISLDDASGSRSNRDAFEGTYPFTVTSALVLPLEGEDDALGALGLFSKEHGLPFADEDVDLMRLVAANVSTAVRLHNANQARLRSERLGAIGRLLSQVIHDFRAPMTVISGYVQLMAEAGDLTQRQEFAEEILRQFDILTSMQREVLAFARGESSLFIRRVFLRKFFSDLRPQIEQELRNSPVVLTFDVDNRAAARFDEGRVARAVHNLVRNAVEAMGDRGGELTIASRIEEEALVIRVSDTGPGIPDAIRGRLFESFVTANKSSGTGLGLAIVHKIAEEHGGEVRVESSPGGATFELVFPQDLGPKSSPPAKPSRPRVGAPAHERRR